MKSTCDLSGKGLSAVPCDEESNDCRTLLLDGNDITAIANLEKYTSLEKLSLAHNSIIKLNGISAGRHLKVVDVQNNSIMSVEGLELLVHLEWLNLSGNSLRNVDGIGDNVLLRHLDVSDNCISMLPDIHHLGNLKALLLHGNLLRNLASLADLLPPSLALLTLADNHFNDLTELLAFVRFVDLQQVSLLNNPCTVSIGGVVHYRSFILDCINGALNIDGTPVDEQDRERHGRLQQCGTFSGLRMGDQDQLVSSILAMGADVHTESSQDDQHNDRASFVHLSSDSNRSLLDSESTLLPLDSFASVDDFHVDDSLRSLSWTELLSQEQRSRLQTKPEAGSTAEAMTDATLDRICPAVSGTCGTASVEASMSAPRQDGAQLNHPMAPGLSDLQSTRQEPHGKRTAAEVTSAAATTGDYVELTAEEAKKIMDLAACVVQSHVKAWRERRRFLKRLNRERAATCIQAAWRGFRTRHSQDLVMRLRHTKVEHGTLARISHLEKRLQKLSSKETKQSELVVGALTMLWKEISDVKQEVSDLMNSRGELMRTKEEFTKTCSSIMIELHSALSSAQQASAVATGITTTARDSTAASCTQPLAQGNTSPLDQCPGIVVAVKDGCADQKDSTAQHQPHPTNGMLEDRMPGITAMATVVANDIIVHAMNTIALTGSGGLDMSADDHRETLGSHCCEQGARTPHPSVLRSALQDTPQCINEMP